MRKNLAVLVIAIIGVAMLFSCAGMTAKPTASNFKTPVITLESFMVPQYDGFWYYSKKVKPTKGRPGDRGAPLPMTFLFNIENPNPYPVLLEGFRFTVAIEGFDLVTVNNDDAYWIPAGKTDQVRATTMITARSALLSLLVTGGFKLKAMGMNPWQALEKWWTGVPELKVPVTLHEGAATFSAGGVTKVVSFQAKFP
ncbi:MAG: hypothetical protein JRF59_00155 [Deltaproteobacteria bacterium]|nr:hypothetical protein [Deltaproteobacteria bacterium]MBW2007334.1 hypothetical protein [Deltaproteobacteria bacterium]MBW2101581.1 hypothetical protein [Deltaproteobacteria bacterium]MBW2346237.1 hypothetical protein [Deltaproteobacteria bacterium]RLB39356.1 MAG: hypothetical protein DRH20_03810 [Deltaproteobacteria bacterium]